MSYWIELLFDEVFSNKLQCCSIDGKSCVVGEVLGPQSRLRPKIHP
jgi:hypothetical protein